VSLPACDQCGGQTWVSTYRVQIERVWSTSLIKPKAHLESEDEDHGEWDIPSCSACGNDAPASFHDSIFDALTTI
jgi:hypothetical protein